VAQPPDLFILSLPVGPIEIQSRNCAVTKVGDRYRPAKASSRFPNYVQLNSIVRQSECSHVRPAPSYGWQPVSIKYAPVIVIYERRVDQDEIVRPSNRKNGSDNTEAQA
jgi:hypothetical protein